MLIKGNVLPDEQNKMETSGLSSTKIVVYYSKLTKICLERRIERIKRISFYTKIIKKLAKNSQKLQKSLPKLQNILHMCNICSNFEHLPWLMPIPSQLRSQNAEHTTVRSKFYKKIGYALIIRYPSSHFQASLNE